MNNKNKNLSNKKKKRKKKIKVKKLIIKYQRKMWKKCSSKIKVWIKLKYKKNLILNKS